MQVVRPERDRDWYAVEIFGNSSEGRGDSAATIQSARPFGLAFKARALLANATLRRGFLSLVDQGICSVTTFATAILIGRACTQAELGIYYLALTVIVVLSNIQGELITAPYTIYRSRRTPKTLPLYEGSVFVHQALSVSGIELGSSASSASLAFSNSTRISASRAGA